MSDNAAVGRFEVSLDGHHAELVYRRRAQRLVLIHTAVPEELSGRGIGGLLVRTALDVAEEENLTVAPYCPFARSWLERHPDEAARVQIDWTVPS